MGDGEKNATLSARPGDGCVSFVIVIPFINYVDGTCHQNLYIL